MLRLLVVILFFSVNTVCHAASDIYCPKNIDCGNNYDCNVPQPFHSSSLRNIKRSTYVFVFANTDPNHAIYRCVYRIYPRYPSSELMIISEQKIQPDIYHSGNRWAQINYDKIKGTFTCMANNPRYCPFL